VRARTEELKSALSNLELTNDELVTARDVSERANRFKTRFFTAVGHDLLQPLHAARLSVTALAEINGTARQLKLAVGVEHALSTIEDLLKSILDISKLEAGAMTPQLQRVSVAEMFDSLAVNIGPMARIKNLNLTWRRTNYTVTSDPLMLRRILQNLIANAVQYTQRGEIMLAARRRGGDVRIEVWDTGPGIPPAHLDLIFEEFHRGPGIDRPVVGGFGLGLSIVQLMARALGHRVDLCSSVDHGTRFSISAPFSGTVDHTAMTTGTSGQTYGLSGAKVLVIDNDKMVLESMQALLERWSCETYLVRDDSDLGGLFDAPGFRPDIVLADYHLDDDGCGLDAVARLRAALGSNLPAIVITADHSSAIADRAGKGGCEILLKPVKPAELRALMTHLLAQAADSLV